MKTIKIGILGFGNIGTGTYELLEMNRQEIETTLDAKVEIAKILVRDASKDRGLDVPKGTFTTNADDILNNPEIDIVIEVLGGIEPATSYMLTAMKNGKHVVTANKAALAANYNELIETAKANNIVFRFEASVCGGIPILSILSGSLKANKFEEVLGILNGTTNYILTMMAKEGMDYETALKQAQELGFAEADPTADVEGIDAANKLTILIALMFGEYVAPEDIPTTGITKVTLEKIEEARSNKCKIKLIAHAKRDENGKLFCEVRPMHISETHPLANINKEYNAVFVKGNAVDDVMLYGKGAGPFPTGSAVMGDVIEIIKNAIK